jgi:hypothetical protein
MNAYEPWKRLAPVLPMAAARSTSVRIFYIRETGSPQAGSIA